VNTIVKDALLLCTLLAILFGMSGCNYPTKCVSTASGACVSVYDSKGMHDCSFIKGNDKYYTVYVK